MSTSRRSINRVSGEGQDTGDDRVAKATAYPDEYVVVRMHDKAAMHHTAHAQAVLSIHYPNNRMALI